MSPIRTLLSSFLIGLGVFLLLDRFGFAPAQWLLFGRLWPVALVFLGLWVLDRGRKLRQVPLFLLGLVLAAFAGTFYGWISGESGASSTSLPQGEEFTRPFPEGIRRGTFRLEAGAGTFFVEGETAQLLSATVRGNRGHYVLTADRLDQSEDVRLVQEGKRRSWLFSRSGNRVDLKFNPTIPWDFQFSVGASRFTLDLSSYRVERVSVESGVSDIRLRLGDKYTDTRCAITAGASTIKIFIPWSSACEIDVDAPLSRKNFKDFERTPEGTYRTENFNTAEARVFISLEAGVSSLTVTRY